MLLLGLFALFLGCGLVAQGYLYQNPADGMPIRALVAAGLVAGFITMWVWIDQRSPGRYDTFFEFKPQTTTEFQEFDAVRWTGDATGGLKLDSSGNPVETTVKYRRAVGGQGIFVEEGTGKPFERSGSTSSNAPYMTGAILVKAPDDPQPVRYNATVKDGPGGKGKTYTPEPRFVEEKGSRFVEAHKLGTLVVPSTGTVVVSLVLNFALFVVWLAALWLVLRFSLGHALIFTGALGLVTLIAIMPILFKQNRVPPKPAAPAATMRSLD